MTSNNTRREFLQSVGATGIATISTWADEESVTSLNAVDLLIPASEVPTGFKQQPTPESNLFIDALYAADPGTTSADIAVQAYWKGGEQTRPKWVLSSLAIVADDSILRETLEDAVGQSYGTYVEEYAAETNIWIQFERTRTQTSQASEWRVNIIEQSDCFNQYTGAGHIFTDLMHLQFFGNVVLATLAFGPTDTGPSVDSLVDQYATVQHTRYDNHGATQ
jgi:hypothetical protein